jgi:Tol biopolymer transport system component
MIRIIDVATGTLEPLGVHGVYPSWSPDGAHIAYLSAFDGTLMIMNSDGSTPHAVVASGQIYGQTYDRQSIAWSPDSHWLVVHGGLAGIIYGSPGQGTSLELVNVTTGQVIPLSYAAEMDSPSWVQ